MEFVKKHKSVVVVTLICLVLFILAFLAVYRMFYPSNSKSVYGNRLDNAPLIDNAVIEKIKKEIVATDLVEEISYSTNVAIMKFFIDVKADTKVEKAKDLTSIILNNLSTKVIAFYDIEVYFTEKTEKNSNYPLIGYHSKNATEFSWAGNVSGDLDEE